MSAEPDHRATTAGARNLLAHPVSGSTWDDLSSWAARSLGEAQEAKWIVEEATQASRPDTRGRRAGRAPDEAVRRVIEMVRRRRQAEPLQHVLGHWSFRSIEVGVDLRALIPRPETEVVTEAALSELDRSAASADPGSGHAARLAVVDLGTGSGVIALSIATERPFAEVTATDRSQAALDLAGENARRQRHDVCSRLCLRRGEWYSALPQSLEGSVAVIVSNPPYLARAEWDGLEPVVRLYDPYEALVAGETGLEAIEAIVRGAPRFLARHGAVVVEIAPHQREAALAIAHTTADPSGRSAFESVEVLTDLAGRARVLVGRS